MAKVSKIVSCLKKQRRAENRRKLWLKPVKWTRVYNMCKLCWRTRWYLWDFKMCRICFRKLASEWKIAWVTKSSW